MKSQLRHSFEGIISLENLLEAWREFVRGKRNKNDVQEFSLRLMDNILQLHHELANHSYKHGGYTAFNISDPKPRSIHKAIVRDRLLHHAVYRILYPFFDKTFIADSFSCRRGKGTHKALNRFRQLAYRASSNHTRTCWVLKCDIEKFFANIDHAILLGILATYIPDKNILRLLQKAIDSFSSEKQGIGLPLGNLTSQLLVNVYMNELDQFVKHRLKVRHYIRYADDFVLFSRDRELLEAMLLRMEVFLRQNLRLQLHPNKVSICTVASGVDFLGWVHFSDHRVLRTTTKYRMLNRIQQNPNPETYQSYTGLLVHGNTQKLRREVRRYYLTAQDDLCRRRVSAKNSRP